MHFFSYSNSGQFLEELAFKYSERSNQKSIALLTLKPFFTFLCVFVFLVSNKFKN